MLSLCNEQVVIHFIGVGLAVVIHVIIIVGLHYCCVFHILLLLKTGESSTGEEHVSTQSASMRTGNKLHKCNIVFITEGASLEFEL